MRITRALFAGAILLALMIGSSLLLSADDLKVPHVDTKAAPVVKVVKKSPAEMFPLTGHVTGYWSWKIGGVIIVVLVGVAAALMVPANKQEEEKELPRVSAVVPPLRKIRPATQFYVYR